MVAKKKGDAERIIESVPGGIVCTGDGVLIYQLLAVKHALRLEERGLVMGRGRRKLRPQWAEKFDLPKQASTATVIRRIDEEIRKLEKANGIASKAGTEA